MTIETSLAKPAPTTQVSREACEDWVRRGCQRDGEICRAANSFAPFTVGQTCDRALHGALKHKEDVDTSVCNTPYILQASRTGDSQASCTLREIDKLIGQHCKGCVGVTYMCMRGTDALPFKDAASEAACVRVPNDREALDRNLRFKFGDGVAEGSSPRLFNSLRACERACDDRTAYPPRAPKK